MNFKWECRQILNDDAFSDVNVGLLSWMQVVCQVREVAEKSGNSHFPVKSRKGIHIKVCEFRYKVGETYWEEEIVEKGSKFR